MSDGEAGRRELIRVLEEKRSRWAEQVENGSVTRDEFSALEESIARAKIDLDDYLERQKK